jgi:hypothetical protein
MTRSRAVRGIAVLALVLLLAACAAGPNDTVPPPGTDVAGFWLGLWHGMISPITFVISLFTDDVNIYEVYNNGNWYDFGFIFGVSIAFSGAAGSGAAGRKRSRR